VRAGKLHYPIQIERRADVSDGQGGITRSWIPWRTVWAAIEPLTGQEAMLAGQLEGKLSHRIRIRYPGNVSSSETVRHTMRILHEGRQFNVRSVVDVNEDHRELHLMCEEFVDLPVNS
jgi:SPP1 family predicted phage head-tail adaptor